MYTNTYRWYGRLRGKHSVRRFESAKRSLSKPIIQTAMYSTLIEIRSSEKEVPSLFLSATPTRPPTSEFPTLLHLRVISILNYPNSHSTYTACGEPYLTFRTKWT